MHPSLFITPLPLTPREQDVYDTVCNFVEDHSRPPTIRDLMRLLELKSRGQVEYHLRALALKGYLEFFWGTARGLRPRSGGCQVSREGPWVVLRVVGRCRQELTPEQARSLARDLLQAAGPAGTAEDSAPAGG